MSAETVVRVQVDEDRLARSVRHHIASHRDDIHRDVLNGAARRLLARAEALRGNRPGYSDPLADALWEGCTRGEDHGFIYGDPRAIAAVALEALAADLAGSSRTPPDAAGQIRTTPDDLGEASRG
ncbi:hypothetical protein AB0J63_26785 [Streptosporangium canum]|uniref:hypothetical protein n=1 Tax=Streptosporangium canum TaxID=324952 RepID=UPI0034187555